MIYENTASCTKQGWPVGSKDVSKFSNIIPENKSFCYQNEFNDWQ